MTVVCLVILAGIFWGDFFLKNYIESHVDEREEREICRGEFLIRKHHNKGMMLNAGQKRRRLVAVVSLVFTLILTIVFIVSLGHRGNNLLRLGLSLLLGGAFSNTYDRLRRGYVVDYVSFPVKWQAFRKIVFNCSDFCIIIGALLSALGMLLNSNLAKYPRSPWQGIRNAALLILIPSRGYWFLKAFQNVELPAYAVPCRRCLSEDVDIF